MNILIINDLKKILVFFENVDRKNFYGICKVVRMFNMSIQTKELLSNSFELLEDKFCYTSVNMQLGYKRGFKRVEYDGAYHFGTDKQRIKFLKNLIKKLENER